MNLALAIWLRNDEIHIFKKLMRKISTMKIESTEKELTKKILGTMPRKKQGKK